MNNPKVSVIVTTYKRNSFLRRALKSVLCQTFSDLEVIVVDDNNPQSEYTEEVKNIIKSLDDARITYVSMGNNSGACNARNRGFEISKGEYVNFLDDDDIFHPTKIKEQLKKFEEVNISVGMIGCFAEIKDENDKLIQYDRNPVSGDVFFSNLCHSLCQTSLPLIRRDVFKKSGGFEDIISSQEHLMLARVLDVCPYYDYVDKELVTIYHHSGERISNDIKKPLGAIRLSVLFERYYSKLTNEQIHELELCMNANIINAYVLVDDRKKAKEYFAKRLMISHRFGIDEYKLLFGVLFGHKAKRKIRKLSLRINNGFRNSRLPDISH